LCLVLSEYVTESWVTVYDDGETHHVQWLPIALGMASTTQGSMMWDNLQLPRPTMEARLGLPTWQVRFQVFSQQLTDEGQFCHWLRWNESSKTRVAGLGYESI
jgi:hypothetical protein